MTVCANRTDDPGFFTPCWNASGGKGCPCGDQVRRELEAPPRPCCGSPINCEHLDGCAEAPATSTPTPTPSYVRWVCPGCGNTAQVLTDTDVRCTCGTVSRTAGGAA